MIFTVSSPLRFKQVKPYPRNLSCLQTIWLAQLCWETSRSNYSWLMPPNPNLLFEFLSKGKQTALLGVQMCDSSSSRALLPVNKRNPKCGRGSPCPPQPGCGCRWILPTKHKDPSERAVSSLCESPSAPSPFSLLHTHSSLGGGLFRVRGKAPTMHQYAGTETRGSATEYPKISGSTHSCCP